MHFLALLGALAIATMPFYFAIRWTQRWFVHGVAALAEYIAPERQRQGSGLMTVGWVLLSGVTLLYVTSAWSAACMTLPRAAADIGEGPPQTVWPLLTLGFIWCLVTTVFSTKIALGFNDPQQLHAYINIFTRAKWEKAVHTFGVAIVSSWVVLLTCLVTLVLFALWPTLSSWNGWVLPLCCGPSRAAT